MNGPTVNGAGTQDNDIVISGISGRFPDSNNVKELKENLFNKRDLVTDDDRRWKLDHPEIPQRTGKINNIEKFDALFFGVHFKQAHTMDPMCRMLLEHTYEAVVDAGYNPRQLRNSKTGVFIGACFSESEKTWFYEKLQVNGFGITGCSRAMLANRISYWLGVTGPSYTVDSACSSSLYALEHAYRSLKDGLCDAAIVGGANLCLHPYVSLQFSRLGVLSEDGKCKSFDADANGYTRSETVSVAFLQKAKDAKRIYATVVHARTNCDGFKEQGITFPSSAMQSALLEEFYHECGIPPSIVSFMEAHGTGTRIGDPEEVNALDKIFCKGRKGPLKIGSIKSNLGHAEPASAMNSIAKVLIAMETGYIPPNLHYNKPREGVKALEEGRIQVVTELTPWDGGYVGINSFGFGGANCHVLLKSNPKQKVNSESPADMLQRLVCVSGRTEEAVKCLIDELESRPVDVEQVALFHDIHSDDIPGHLYRGYCVIGPKGAQDPPVREIRNYLGSKLQLWFVFSGMGSQWPGMGKDLLRFPVFAAAIKKCDAVLKPRGIDIYDIITNKDKAMFDNILNSFVGIAAVQIGLVDILTSVGIVPDRIIGHSVGELGCAYADGCFTAEQMVLAAYSRGLASIETDVIRGSMAAVGLGYEDLKDMCPPEIEIACHNGPESSTISGPAEDMKVFVAELQAKGIFAREVNCSNIPYHSRYIADAGPKLLAYLKKVIPDPKPRSEKWLSTSVPRDDWSKPAARLSSAEYHTNNLLSSVLFEETAALIPKDSVTIEIAPHGLLQAILRRSLPPSVINIAMTQRGHKDNVNVVLQSLGNLYTTGLHPQINKLYPEVSYPVSRGTPMISPHIRWEHSDDWYVTSYRMQEKITSGERNIEITLGDEDYEYMKGHVIDGRNLVPATGYLALIWETVGMMKGLLFTEVSVVFEDVKFLRATTIPAQGTVALTVMVQKGTGRFEIVEGNTAVCTGKVRVTTNPDEEKINPSILNIKDEPEVMSTKDVYKELRLRGYNYSGIFCSIHSASVSASNGHLIWRNNWVSFMDNMLQMKILGRDTRGLFVPTAILKIVIDTKKHLNQIRALVSDDKLLPVHVHNHLDAVTCGGIEIRGLSANAIARRKPMGEPVLEEYTFIPHYDRAEVPLLEALQMATHIALENSLQSKMKTIELIMESDKVAPNKLASPLISEILGNLPLIQATITVVAPEGRFESGAIPENISVIEERKLAPDNSAYLVVGYNLLSRGESLKLLLTTLQEGGFILSRESKGDFNSSKIPSTLKLSLVLQKTADNENIVLLRKSEGLPKKYSVVKVVNDDFSWVSELQRVLQDEEGRMGQSRTYLVGDKDFENGLLGFANCLRKESRGDSLRVVLIQDPKAPEFSLQNPLYAKQLASDLAFNVLRPGSTWGSYRHLPLAPLSPQPVHHGLVNQTTRGDISSLKWLEGPIRDNSSNSGMIYIYYAACNFRDIMLASGKLGVETITKNRREEENINGLEYSGIDSSGRRLMGIITYGAMSNLCVADSHLQWEIPQSWSFEDAGTVPVVYATCVYALYLKGNMKKGDKVLIHAGTGGVGQAAINLALHEGCEVFTTVGTPEKRRFIREHFPQIPEDHIGSSRDTKFEKMILRSTKGKGVDIVLNSLSEDKLHASVRCVSARGRFLEIGKFDLAANNNLGMGIFLKEVGFHGVMLDSMFDAPAERKLVLANLMNKHLKSGAIKPLTRTIFPHDQVEQAYRYMAAGKHIGKVMLKIRDEKEPLNKPIMALPRYYCREDRSYVIFGGLGGFGLELADWLVIRGAKNLVLTSRKGVSNGYQQLRITLWRSYGVNVSILTEGEAWKRENCAKVLKKAASMAPVGGIFNLAVVLSDSLFENQTSHSFMDSFKSKVGITKQLDALSREMCPQLEQFVVFSSVSCGRGNIGQTNYGMANSVMERICERRFAEGLPGLAIQWGAVGDVGLVADMQEEHKELVIGGTLQQKITSCLQTLDHFLRQSNRPVVASMVVAEKRTSGTGSENVVDTVLNIMSIKDVKSVSHQTSLAELGMDSMMAVEIKQSLEREFGLYLTPQDIRGLNFAKLVEMDAVVAEKNKSRSAEPVHDALLGMKALVHVLENTYVTTETCVELPTEQREGRSEIYFVPGVEGLAQVFAPVVPKVKSPAVCLQLGVEHKDLDTIEKMTNKLWPDIKERTKGRRAFTLVGFSFGSIIAIELARKLEHEGMNGRLILLDGSPEHLKSVIEQHLPSSTIPETENSILVGIMDMFAPQISSELLKRIEKCTKWEEKLDIHFELLPKSPTSLSNEEMKSLCTAILKRVIAVKKYCETPRAPIRSTIILMKPSIQSVRAAPEDYGLQKLTKDKVEIHVVDGNHLTMLEADKVAAAINGDPLDDADSFKEKLMEDGALITPIDSANQSRS